MAADLLDETHNCGADALQGAEYTSDGTLCVLQMKAKCAGDAVGGARTPLDDIIRGSAALDALDSNLLRVQQNHAYSPIVGRRAGCATPPVGDTSIFPVLRDDSGLYTPLEPSDSTPTQKIEQIYQIPHSPSEPTTSNDRLPTKAPKTTNAPEHGTVNATEPSRATACKGAPEDPTKSGSICQNNFLPSETISIAPQQGTASSVPTSTPELEKGLSRSNFTEIHCVEPHDDRVLEEPVVVAATPGHEHLATGADLPEDLFDKIIDSVIEITVWGGIEFTERNRYVGACALTCRYWAKRLRSWNFADMRISSERQIKDLDTLLAAPSIPTLQPVAEIIRHLKIIHDGSRVPWIHLITQLIAKYPSLAEDIQLDLELDHYGLAAQGHPFRSIFYYLPRTPPFLYHKFEKLSLKNTRFASPQDLFTLLSEFRNLRCLHLVNIVWSIPSPLQFPPPPLPESLDWVYIEPPHDAVDAGDDVVLWMLAASFGLSPVNNPGQQALGVGPYKTVDSAKHIRSQLPPTAPSEVRAALDIVRAFYPPGLPSAQPPSGNLFWSINRSYPRDETKCMKIRIRAMLEAEPFPLSVTPAIALELQYPSPLDTRGSISPRKNLRIHAIHLNFELLQRHSTQKLLSDMDWMQFFSSTSTLTCLGDVNILVKSKEEQESFVDAHAALLNTMLEGCQKKLGCRYRYQLRRGNSTNGADYVISATV